MNIFEPATFSTDWEIMLFDRQDRVVPTEKVIGLAGQMSRDLGLPVQIDHNTLECAMDINHSYTQIRDRIVQVTDHAADVLGAFELDMCPAASHPLEGLYNASHIHVGTVRNEAAAILLEADLIQYTPVFAALAANSPLTNRRRGEYKSYRVRNWAHYCTQPVGVRDPELSQDRWAMDAGPKLRGAATLEVRITDAASSRQYLAELATFIAAFVHFRGGKTPTKPTPSEYQDAMINRWLAARHGLQATFFWDGRQRPVAEIADEMLDECREALQVLGAVRSDLGVLETMIRKRVCQADFATELASRYPEDFMLASVYTKVLRHWDAFDNYVADTPTLDPAPAPDSEEVLAIHRDFIGESSPFYHSRDAMGLPPPVADAVLAQLEERGWVRRDRDAYRGTLLTRIA